MLLKLLLRLMIANCSILPLGNISPELLPKLLHGPVKSLIWNLLGF